MFSSSVREEREELRLVHLGSGPAALVNRGNLVPPPSATWSNEFNALLKWGKIREAFEGGFFDEAGFSCIEDLLEFESIERSAEVSRHQLEE